MRCHGDAVLRFSVPSFNRLHTSAVARQLPVNRRSHWWLGTEKRGTASPWHGVSLSPGTQPILMNVADQGRITARHNSGSSPKTCIFPGKSTTGWNGTSTLTILAKGSWARRDGWPSYCERMIFWFGQTPVPSPLSAATAAHLPRHGSSEPVTAIRSKKQGQRVSAPPSGKQLRFHALPHADRGALT